MIYSSNDKLIEEVRKRLLEYKKKNYYNYYKTNGINFQDLRRISTLAQRRNSIGRRSSIKLKADRNLLTEDKINLRLVPIIKSVKEIIRFRKDNSDNHKRYNIEENAQKNSSRYNLNTKNSKINSYSNSNSNIYITTFPNGLSTSNSLGKTKIFMKRHLFLSPFQVGKNKNNIFKKLVNISKEIHSPKNKENNLVNNVFNIKSLKKFHAIKTNHNKKKENIRISEKIFQFDNSFICDKKEKMRNKSTNKNKKIKLLLEEPNNEYETINHLSKNEKKRRANCYYNKLHLNKIYHIIEKYSYNSKD